MPFSETPGHAPDEAKDRIAHARLTRGTTPVLMASDTLPGMPFQQGNNFSVSVECEGNAEIERLFAVFGEKGTAIMPLQEMFWGARFGMVKDQFGVHWMLNFQHTKLG